MGSERSSFRKKPRRAADSRPLPRGNRWRARRAGVRHRPRRAWPSRRPWGCDSLRAHGARGDLAQAAKRAGKRAQFHRHDHELLIWRLRERVERGDVFLRDQEVHRNHVAVGGRLADHPRRHRVGLSGSLDRLGGPERGIAPAFRFEHERRLASFGAGDVGLAHAFSLEDHGALFTLGLHLPAHRLHEVLRGYDVLDLNARDFDAPRLRGCVDHHQKARVDLVAMREQLVQVHRTHDRAHIGHDDVAQRQFKIGDLIGRAARIEHLIEGDAVHRHGCIVLGDDFLARDVHDLLHDVELAADGIDVRNDKPQTRSQGFVVAAEALDRVIVTLRHLAHAHESGDDHEGRDDKRENGCALQHHGARL